MTTNTQSLIKFTSLEKHHSVGSWQLVLCDGSRFGSPIPKEEKKPKTCAGCGFFRGNDVLCQRDCVTNSSMRACSRAISPTELYRKGA